MTMRAWMFIFFYDFLGVGDFFTSGIFWAGVLGLGLLFALQNLVSCTYTVFLWKDITPWPVGEGEKNRYKRRGKIIQRNLPVQK